MVDRPSGASIAVCSGAAPDRQGHRFVPHARRLAVALVALLGLVVTVLGAWLAFTLGTSGTARFTATASEPLVIGPSTLDRVAVPVRVSATSKRGPVFLGVSSPQDASDLVGSATHQQVVLALAAGWLWRCTRARAARQQGRAPRTSGRRSDLEAHA